MNIDFKILNKLILSILSIVLIYIILQYILSRLGITVSTIKSIADSIGSLGIFIILFFIVLSTISPLPLTPSALATIVLYGSFYGFFLISTGILIGSILDFYLSRNIGRKKLDIKYPLYMATINDMVKSFGFEALVFLRVFPIISLDISSYIAGVTKIKFRIFVLSAIIGIIPISLTYSIIGINFESSANLKIVFSLLFGFVGLLVSIILSSLYPNELKKNCLE